MLNLIENLSADTARQLYEVLPQDYVTAYMLFALLDSFAVDGAWVQTENEKVTALVIEKGQTKAFVAASKDADFEELRYFLRALGGVVIHAAPEYMRALGVTPFSRHGLMALHELPETGREAKTVTEDLRPVYQLLTQNAREAAGDTMQYRKYAQKAYKEWLSAQSRGIFGGYTVVKAVFAEQNSLLSAAIADILGDFIYIRDVVTDADYRKMGYGRDCVLGLCKELKTEKNHIFLLSGDLKTENFYKKCGFQREAAIELGIIEL